MTDPRKIEFRKRSKQFALEVIWFCSGLHYKKGLHTIINQLLRSSGSVAANFREASRARSTAEFISKVEICSQEADESMLWLELINEGYFIESEKIKWLINESNELLSILITMAINAKRSQHE